MTPEQQIRAARDMAYRAVTEGVNLRYLEQLRLAHYALADLADRLVAERDEAQQAVADRIRQGSEQADEAIAWRKRAEAAERREAELREALTRLADSAMHGDLVDTENAIEAAHAALAAVPAADPTPAEVP